MPTDNRPIYLDYHATTPTDPGVVEAMRPWWSEDFGNPSSGDHAFGWRAHAAIEGARREVAALIGAETDEILFTSGATEANNIALLGAARGHAGDKNHIIVSAVEHKCVLAAAHHLSQNGWHVDVLPVDGDGVVRLDQLEALLSDRTLLVSVMAVNNEIGTVQPIKAIGALCENAGALLHCDAAQAPAAIEIDIFAANISLLSLSGHKIYGPNGVGALFVRGDVLPALTPIHFGGGQEHGLRSGTLPTPLCVGLGKACVNAVTNRQRDATRLSSLRDRLWTGFQSAAPLAKINGPLIARHPGNLNVRFPGIDGSALVGRLQPHVAAGTGSACTSGIPHPSHVLEAIGLSPEQAESSVRFGVGRYTTDDEIQRTIDLVGRALEHIKQSAA